MDTDQNREAEGGSHSDTNWAWAAAGGGLILLLGLVLVLLPVTSRNTFAQTTGWFLVVASMLELAVGLKIAPAREGRIVVTLSLVTLAAALLVLLRPDAYPLIFVAMICLAIRGVGALVAAASGAGRLQLWVLARGLVDLVLGGMLISGAPLTAVISVLSGKTWPPSGTAILGNFVAISMISAGICLLGMAWSHRRTPTV